MTARLATVFAAAALVGFAGVRAVPRDPPAPAPEAVPEAVPEAEAPPARIDVRCPSASPDAAELARVQAELERLRTEIEGRQGKVAGWPDAAAAAAGAASARRLADTLREGGVIDSVVDIDCDEYPCLLSVALPPVAPGPKAEVALQEIVDALVNHGVPVADAWPELVEDRATGGWRASADIAVGLREPVDPAVRERLAVRREQANDRE